MPVLASLGLSYFALMTENMTLVLIVYSVRITIKRHLAFL